MSPYFRLLISSALALSAAGALGKAGYAATPIYAEGHADIGVAYSTVGASHFTLHTRFDSNVLTESSQNPGEIANQIFPANAVAIRARDDDPPILRQQKIDPETMEILYDLTGPDWDFLGVAQDEPVWVLPQTSEIGKPFFGFATDSLSPVQWSGPMSYALEEIVSGPVGGHASLWQTNFFGTPVVKFASSDGINVVLGGVDNELDDDFTQLIGGHDHYNWGFSKPGVYEVRLGATANRTGVGAVHGSGILTFLVGNAAGGAQPGDYNADGAVDGADFLDWQRSLGSNVSPGTGADGSGNGLVDADDLQLWKEHFGQGAATTAAVNAVPEPAGASLAFASVISFAGMARWRRRNAA